MVNFIDLMEKSLQQHNLVNFIPNNVKNKTEDKPPEDQGKGHVLTNISSSLNRWILDSGSSNHIYTLESSDLGDSLLPCTRPSMLMGDKKPMRVRGEGSMDLDYGNF